MERTVRVRGEVKTVWQNLLNTLAVHRYEIEMQVPYTQLSAKRGSKLSSFLLEGTKGGFRELNVALFPKGEKETEIQFKFKFPSWAITLPGTKKECSAMIDEFVRLAEQAIGQPASTIEPTGTVSCPSCGAEVRQGAKFCAQCGASLVRACAKCGAELRPGAKFCSSCGAPV